MYISKIIHVVIVIVSSPFIIEGLNFQNSGEAIEIWLLCKYVQPAKYFANITTAQA